MSSRTVDEVDSVDGMDEVDRGNLRFVQHVVRNAEFALCTKPGLAKTRRGAFKAMVQEFERQVIMAALAETAGKGNYNKTCERLGIHRNSLRVKLRELKIYVRRRTVAGRPRGGVI